MRKERARLQTGTGSRLLSAHARYAAYAAESCGYAFRSLDGEDGYLFEVSNGERRAAFAAGAGSPYGLNDVRAASIARDKAFCAEVLRSAGIPAIPGRKFFVTERWAAMRTPGREPEDALNYARTAKYPIFCKPLSASNGLYAEAIDDYEAFADYMRRVAREHFAILVQPFIVGAEYRVFVLDGEPIFSYLKRPPQVTGDGRRSLAELTAALPRQEGSPALKPRARGAGGVLLKPDHILSARETVSLDGPANRSAGGRAESLQSSAAEPLARIAVAAANAIGLRLAGVDLFDVSEARDLSQLVVIEVNSNPMIATLEDHGRWDLIAAIWRANIAAALR